MVSSQYSSGSSSSGNRFGQSQGQAYESGTFGSYGNAEPSYGSDVEKIIGKSDTTKYETSSNKYDTTNIY